MSCRNMRKDPGLASTHKHLCTCTHKHRHILSLKGSCCFLPFASHSIQSNTLPRRSQPTAAHTETHKQSKKNAPTVTVFTKLLPEPHSYTPTHRLLQALWMLLNYISPLLPLIIFLQFVYLWFARFVMLFG